MHPVKGAALTGVADTLNTAAINVMAYRMVRRFAEIAHERPDVLLSWSGEIGKETGKSMREYGSRAVFDCGPKAVT